MELSAATLHKPDPLRVLVAFTRQDWGKFEPYLIKHHINNSKVYPKTGREGPEEQ